MISNAKKQRQVIGDITSLRVYKYVPVKQQHNQWTCNRAHRKEQLYTRNISQKAFRFVHKAPANLQSFLKIKNGKLGSHKEIIVTSVYQAVSTV
jgi:hypothetical protein